MNKPTTYITTILFLLLFANSSFQAKAQRADSVTYHPETIYYWEGFHTGFGRYFFNGGLDATMLLNNAYVISAKGDFNANVRFLEPPLQHIAAYEGALMVGAKLTHNKYSNWLLLSGISSVTVRERGVLISSGTYTYDNVYADDLYYSKIGLPVMVKLIVAPSSMLAMDFSAGATFNSYRTLFAVTFGVAFGKVRSGTSKPLPPHGNMQAPGGLPRLPTLFPHL